MSRPVPRASAPGLDDAPGLATWHLEARELSVDGQPHRLRLARFASGWIASADGADGPTLGVDRSPYLAARHALEPLGVGLVEAMTAVGPVGRTDQAVEGPPATARNSGAASEQARCSCSSAAALRERRIEL